MAVHCTAAERGVLIKKKLGNVAIVNALQLEVAQCQSFSALITTSCQVWSRWTYQLPYYRILLVIHYFTLWPLPLTFDLEISHGSPVTWWNFIPNLNAIDCVRGEVIAISIFDLMTLNHVLRVWLGYGITFEKFDLRQLIRAWIIAFIDADTLCHAVTLTVGPLTLRVRGASSVTWSKSLRNLSEIEWSTAELLTI